MWRFIGLVLLLLVLLGGALYLKGQSDKLPTEGDGSDLNEGDAIKVNTPLKIGALPAPQQPIALSSLVGLREPIVIGGTLFAVAEQQVGARTDGKLQENNVKLGDRVVRGQQLGQMDERFTKLSVEVARVKAESDASIRTAFEKKGATQELYERELRSDGAPADLRIKLFQWRESEQEYIKAIEEKNEARRLLEQKKHELELMKLTSDIDGVVVKVNKRPGSPVRATEILYEIVDTDRLSVDVLAPREAVAGVTVGTRVRFEPERLEAPVRELRNHTAPVTGIALSPDSLLLASCGADGKVVLWDWRAGKALRIGREKGRLVEFLAVAFSPVVEKLANGGSEYRLLIGGADGIARLWTLQVTNGVLTDTGLKEIKKDAGGHTGQIQALAFTPDGKYAVTGGSDFNIFVWNLETGALAYRVQARSRSTAPAHRGFITALAVADDNGTPHLVSVATDKTIKRWKLGADGAELLNTYEGRSGDIGQLGIFPDGKRALFDHADELRVVNLTDGTIEGIMFSRHGQFRNLALVVPSTPPKDPEKPQEDHLILTTTAQGRLQLLTAPTRPEHETFFRKGYRAGFRKNSLLALGGLAPWGWARGVSSVLAAEQPKAAPLPSFSIVPGFPTAAAPFQMPILAPDIKEYEGLAAVPELWNLGSFELRHLKAADGAGVTCGVCAPQGGPLFTGGTDRIVRVWNAPSAAERQETFEATLTYVGAQAETTTTPLVRLRAELDNPKDPARRLMPNTKANLTIFPEAAK